MDDFGYGYITVFPIYKKQIAIYGSGENKLLTVTNISTVHTYQSSEHPGYYNAHGYYNKPFFNMTLYNKNGSKVTQRQIQAGYYSEFGYKDGKWKLFAPPSTVSLEKDAEQKRLNYDYFITLSGGTSFTIGRFDILKKPPQWFWVNKYYPWTLKFITNNEQYSIKLSTFKNQGDYVMYPTY